MHASVAKIEFLHGRNTPSHWCGEKRKKSEVSTAVVLTERLEKLLVSLPDIKQNTFRTRSSTQVDKMFVSHLSLFP